MSENADDFGPPQPVPASEFGAPQPVQDFGPPQAVAPLQDAAPVPAAEPQTDEDYAALMDPMAGTPLSVAAFNAQRGVPHEDVAKAMQYGPALGLDPESLMGDPKALKAAKDEVDFRESIKTLQGAPKLAALLAHNTALAAAAREDLPALNTIEAGVMDVAHGYYARKFMGGDKDAGIRLHDIDRMLSRYDKEEHGLVADVVRMLPTAGAFGATGVVGAVSVGPAAAPGGALAGPFIYMYQTQAGELYARIADTEQAHAERDPSYTPLNQKQMEQAAKKGALMGATLFSVLGNAFNKSLPFVNGALQRLGVNIVAEASEDTAVKLALRKLEEAGAHALSGTLAMTAQAISDDATVQKATTGDVDVGKATSAGVEAFKRVFFPTLLLGAVEPGRAYLKDRGSIRAAPFDVGRIDQMAKMVKSSKMVDRAPEAAEQILGSIVEGSDIETTYIGHEALKNPEVAQAVADVVGEHAVAEALATQGSVPMATEKYLTQIAPGHHDAIREHLRIDQEGASLAEAREIKPDLDAALAAIPADQRAAVEKIARRMEGGEAPKATKVRPSANLFEASFKNKETGEVVETGRFHDIEKLPGGENADLDKWEAGFNDAQGKFLTREEARASLPKELQAYTSPVGLESEDLTPMLRKEAIRLRTMGDRAPDTMGALMAERSYALQAEPDTPERTAKLQDIEARMRSVASRGLGMPDTGKGTPEEVAAEMAKLEAEMASGQGPAPAPEPEAPPKPAPPPIPEDAFRRMAREATEGKRLGDLQPGRRRRDAESAATKALRARAQAAEALGTAEQKAQAGIEAALEGIKAGQRGIREYKYIREAEWAKDLRGAVETGDLSEINRTINDLIKRAQNHPVEALGQGQVDVLKNIKRTVNAGKKWLEGLRTGTELSPETAAGGLYDVGGTQETGGAPQPGTPEFIAAQEHNIKFGEREMRRASSEAERARLKAESASVQATRGTVRAGDLLAQAAEHEQARDYGRALERAETAALEEADKNRRFLQRYTKPEGLAELGKASPEHRDAVQMLLSGFELAEGTSRPEVARRLATMQWMASDEAAGRTPVIPESVLSKLDRFVHWKEMTPQEMRDLADSVRSIVRQAELKNTIVSDQGRRAFGEAQTELIGAATENMKPVPIFQSGDVIPAREKLARLKRGAEAVILKPEEIVRRLDGGAINGPWGRYFWHPLSEAYNRFLVLEDKWSKPLLDAIEAVPKETRRDWKTKTFTVDGRERTMEQALALAMNQGNAGNAFKALEGLKNGKSLGLTDWTQGTVDSFLAHVNRDGWNFAQATWDALDAHWDAIAKHEESLTGLVPEKVVHRGFDLWFDKDGNTVPTGAEGAEKVHFRGGYYPIIYERQFSFLGRSGRGEGDLLSGNYRTATTPQGRLQSRIANYARPIELTLSGLPGVIREFAKDVAMRESLMSAHRIVTDRDIVNTLHQTIGEPNTRVLQSMVLDAANDMVLPANGAEAFLKVANRMRGGVSASVFAWNIAQTTQNLAGVTQIMKHVPISFMREGLRAIVLDPSGTIDFANASSGEMATRAKHINADMTEAHRSIQNKSVLGSTFESAMAPAHHLAEMGLDVFAATDSFTAHLGWRSAYEHAIAPVEKGGLGYDHGAAVRQADRTIRLAIASGRVIDLPSFLRHPVTKLLAPFSGWSNTQLNDYMATKYDAQQLAADGDIWAARRKWAAAHIWVAAGGIAGSLMVFRGPKDTHKDGLDVGDVARWLGIEGLLAPVWFTPYLGAPLKKLAEGEQLRGSLFTPTIGRPIETAIKSAIQIRSKAEKKGLETEDYQKFGLGMLEAVATMEGMPVVQAKNTAGYFLDPKSPKDNPLQITLGVAAGKTAPGKLLDLVK